ncbi:MAG: hypothetical protein Q9159_005127 [Coniocarpon cinnabarinum]
MAPIHSQFLKSASNNEQSRYNTHQSTTVMAPSLRSSSKPTNFNYYAPLPKRREDPTTKVRKPRLPLIKNHPVHKRREDPAATVRKPRLVNTRPLIKDPEVMRAIAANQPISSLPSTQNRIFPDDPQSLVVKLKVPTSALRSLQLNGSTTAKSDDETELDSPKEQNRITNSRQMCQQCFNVLPIALFYRTDDDFNLLPSLSRTCMECEQRNYLERVRDMAPTVEVAHAADMRVQTAVDLLEGALMRRGVRYEPKSFKKIRTELQENSLCLIVREGTEDTTDEEEAVPMTSAKGFTKQEIEAAEALVAMSLHRSG